MYNKNKVVQTSHLDCSDNQIFKPVTNEVIGESNVIKHNVKLLYKTGFWCNISHSALLGVLKSSSCSMANQHLTLAALTVSKENDYVSV